MEVRVSHLVIVMWRSLKDGLSLSPVKPPAIQMKGTGSAEYPNNARWIVRDTYKRVDSPGQVEAQLVEGKEGNDLLCLVYPMEGIKTP